MPLNVSLRLFGVRAVLPALGWLAFGWQATALASDT